MSLFRISLFAALAGAAVSGFSQTDPPLGVLPESGTKERRLEQ